MLRLDWNILFNIINILILYVLLRHFLFKPVNQILEKRQAEADGRFAEADEREAKARESQTRYETLLADAQGEKEKIVAEGKSEAAREYGRIVDEAKDRAAGIVEKAKSDAEKEKQAILQQADGAVRDMVITAAAKVAGGADSPESDRALYDRFLAQAGSGQTQKS